MPALMLPPTGPIRTTFVDKDGFATTVQGSVGLGDLFAGNLARLTVATFTTTQPNSTAGEFVATIQWGDGMMSAGTVTGSNGQYQVTATHTYGQAGTFPVHVQIVDPFMDMLTADKNVGVVEGELKGSGNAQTPIAAMQMSNAPVALFTDSNPQENGSRYTASINWGDHTPASAGSVGGGFGILKVSGSHTYAAAGLYSVATSVFLQGVLVGAAVGEADARPDPADPAAEPAITGPTVVPGFAKYVYTIANPGGTILSWEGDANLTKAIKGIRYLSADKSKVSVFFDNVVASGKLQATIKNAAKPASLPVDVVRITFKSGDSNKINYKNPPIQPINVPKQGDRIYENQIWSYDAVGGAYAMEANLTVATISAAKPGDIESIEMGFIQNVTVTANHADFDQFDPKQRRVSLVESKSYLDYYWAKFIEGRPPSTSTPPWYDSIKATVAEKKGRGFLSGKDEKDLALKGNVPFKITDRPTPRATDIMSLTVGNTTHGVDFFAVVMDFKLYFAVRTIQAANDSEKVYTQREKADWQFDGSGPVDQNRNWKLKGKGNTGKSSFAEVTNGDVVPITTGKSLNETLYDNRNTPWKTVDKK